MESEVCSGASPVFNCNAGRHDCLDIQEWENTMIENQ
jgi:hypothetical protein